MKQTKFDAKILEGKQLMKREDIRNNFDDYLMVIRNIKLVQNSSFILLCYQEIDTLIEIKNRLDSIDKSYDILNHYKNNEEDIVVLNLNEFKYMSEEDIEKLRVDMLYKDKYLSIIVLMD